MITWYPVKKQFKGQKDLSNALCDLGININWPVDEILSETDVFLNWGGSNYYFPTDKRIINHPKAVSLAINKLKAFKLFQEYGVNYPFVTKDVQIARQWVVTGNIILAREKTSSYGGKGIKIIQTLEEFEECVGYTKFWTRHLGHKDEYRVHVAAGNVIDVVQKRRKNGAIKSLETDLVRSHGNGWVFCRKNVDCPDNVKSLAVKAVFALGLDFGAVDLGVSDGIPYVFEVNTAPGLTGTTITKYAEGFKNAFFN